MRIPTVAYCTRRKTWKVDKEDEWQNECIAKTICNNACLDAAKEMAMRTFSEKENDGDYV